MTSHLEQHAADMARLRSIREREEQFHASLKQPLLIPEPATPPAQPVPQTIDGIKAKLHSLQQRHFQSADAVQAEIVRRASPNKPSMPSLPTAAPAKMVATPVQRGISADRYVGLRALYGATSFSKMLNCMASAGNYAQARAALSAVTLVAATLVPKDMPLLDDPVTASLTDLVLVGAARPDQLPPMHPIMAAAISENFRDGADAYLRSQGIEPGSNLKGHIARAEARLARGV